jgi:molybdenum cofactor synthesis domain-containing protein
MVPRPRAGDVGWACYGASSDNVALRYAPRMARSRRILTAELLSIGTELIVGETRDTNGGELARSLTDLGVAVGRIQAVPDDLAVVSAAFAGALERVDLVVSTGGLGPTPDDLTRESIAAVTAEQPTVDPELEAWLRRLWSRRGMQFPEMNLKQAWLIPSATALPNDNGTAPGWWVDRPDGRIVVALPGPPREMRPIWTDGVLPRLRAAGAGADTAHRTFRLGGIGESQLADILGEELLRATNPIVATYARADAVDVRVSAVGDPTPGAPSARVLVDTAANHVLGLIGDYVWAEGDATWPEAIGAALDARGWKLACLEVGTGGSLAALLGDRPWLTFTESLTPDAPGAAGHSDGSDSEDAGLETGTQRGADDSAPGLEALTRRAMLVGGATVGVGVRARPRGDDTAVSVVVVGPDDVHHERRLVFLGGANGRSRTGLAAAAVLLSRLRAGSADARADAVAGADAGFGISGETPGRGPRDRGRRCCRGRAGSDGRR